MYFLFVFFFFFQAEDGIRDADVTGVQTCALPIWTLKLEATQIMDLMEYQLQIRDELLALTGKQTNTYFVSTGTSDRLSNIMQKLVKKLHNQHPKVTTIQQIRTSVITHWLKHYNLREVQYMAGHRYVSTTEGYLVNDLEDLSEEIGKFHPMG